jgi:hypothetical protein
MIKIIKIKGGLGNQMFGYSFYKVIKKRYPFSIVLYDPLDAWFNHNGFELGRVFSDINVCKYRSYRRLRRLYLEFINLFVLVNEDDCDFCKYNVNYLKYKSPLIIYDGFWQNEKYFTSVKFSIRKKFSFKLELLNYSTLTTLNRIKTCESVSIHFRRGDYLLHEEDYGNICDLNYYRRAINYFKKAHYRLCFFVFSDDILWVKDSFPDENFIYIDFNNGNDSWQDLYLMSNCKHNIIANSTFSWWGAWLNNNQNKIVLAPKKWFNNSEDITIIPDTWLKI